MKASEFARQLKATRTSRGWSARCPAHDDQHASPSIATGEAGRVLLYCHAGCSTEAIVDAMGLTMSDLQPEHRGRSTRSVVAEYDSTDESGGQPSNMSIAGYPGARIDGRHSIK